MFGDYEELCHGFGKIAQDSFQVDLVFGVAHADERLPLAERGLFISARKAANDDERTYLHRGIATRAFERRFQLADHVRVNGASHVDGMLHIDLVREIPEALKPRQIEISNGKKAIEAAAVEA